jgi:endonuclease-3
MWLPAERGALRARLAGLRAAVGTTPRALRAARPVQLTRALEAGGMIPALRATRIRAIVRAVEAELGGKLRAALGKRSEAEARKLLKRFPGIGTPGADRVLLFAGLAPVAAVPSSCPHVLVRILGGDESPGYGATYAQARALIEAQIPATFAARRRAWLLLQRHGRERCRARNPQCSQCAVAATCAFFARHQAPAPRR